VSPEKIQVQDDDRFCKKCGHRLIARLLRCENLERLPTDILTACHQVEQAQRRIDEAIERMNWLSDKVQADRKRRTAEFRQFLDRLEERVAAHIRRLKRKANAR